MDSSPVITVSPSDPPAQRQSRPSTANSAAHTDGRESSSYNLYEEPGPDQDEEDINRARSPPPRYPASEASGSTRPPPFDSLYATTEHPSPDPSLNLDLAVSSPLGSQNSNLSVDDKNTSSYPFPRPYLCPSPIVVFSNSHASSSSAAAPAYAPVAPGPSIFPQQFSDVVGDAKRAESQDTSDDKEKEKVDDPAEPPPAYSEGDSPLLSFTYVMAAAGGASSIITQVQQGGPPMNTIGDVGADESITMNLRYGYFDQLT